MDANTDRAEKSQKNKTKSIAICGYLECKPRKQKKAEISLVQ